MASVLCTLTVNASSGGIMRHNASLIRLLVEDHAVCLGTERWLVEMEQQKSLKNIQFAYPHSVLFHIRVHVLYRTKLGTCVLTFKCYTVAIL